MYIDLKMATIKNIKEKEPEKKKQRKTSNSL